MRTDQAEGLRRLLERSGLRVLSVSGSAGSAATATINLAGAMSESGSDVLILDGQRAPNGVAAALGLDARFDLEDVIGRQRELDEVIVRGPAGIMILPMARAASSLAQLSPAAQQRLAERCRLPGLQVDTLLMDAAVGSAGAVLWPGAATRDLIVLAGGSASAVTAAYAAIKRLCRQFGRREFHVLVSDVASEREAHKLYANIAGVARRYLGASLAFMGHVPPDDRLRHAAHLRLPVVTAFPSTPAAGSFRRLAQAVAGWPQTEADSCGFDAFMRRLIHVNGPRPAAA